MGSKSGDRKHGRSKRSPSGQKQTDRSAKNKIRKLLGALKANRTCPNTREKLKALHQGKAVQVIDLAARQGEGGKENEQGKER